MPLAVEVDEHNERVAPDDLICFAPDCRAAGAGADSSTASEPITRQVLPYMASLDGLRGAAVVAVFLFHSGVVFSGGFLGVSTFFTLSGFLISNVLLCGQSDQSGRPIAAGTVLREFWVRRVKRLMPAALLAIALCAAVSWLYGDVSQQGAFRADGIAALGYSANWRFVFSGQSYSGQFASPSPVLHFWSLAIEEQFYLIFPLLIIGLLRIVRLSVRALVPVLSALFAMSALVVHLFDWSNDRVYFGTDTRAAELLAGALLAVTLSVRGRGIVAMSKSSQGRGKTTLGVVGVIAFALMLGSWLRTTESSSWVYAGGLPVYSLISIAVILAAITDRNPIQRLLSSAPLRHLGRISYGVYLFHWPILLWLQHLGAPLSLRLVGGAAMTIAVAWASFVFLEEPIRGGAPRRPGLGGLDVLSRLRQPPAHPGRIAPIAIAALLALIVVTTVPRDRGAAINLDVASGTLVTDIDLSANQRPIDTQVPTAGPVEEHPAVPSGSLPPTTTTVDNSHLGALTPKMVRLPSRPLRMLVMGDSTALFLDQPFNIWGLRSKVWGAANYARIGCGFGRGGYRRNHFGDDPIPPECSNWATEWPRLLKVAKPDIIVVADGFWDATDRRLDGDDTWRAPGDPTYDAYLHKEFGAVADSLSSTGAVVAWLDNPKIRLGSAELPKFNDQAVNEPQRMTRTNEILLDVAATRPSMRVIPYRSFFEAWPGGEMDPALRPDALHVDASGGEVIMQWLGPEVLDAYWSVKESRVKS